MTAQLPRPSVDENVSSTLSSGITDVATTVTVADASKIVDPCYLVIDRVDSAGVLKAASLWEYVKVTNVAGNDLTITRAQGGSTGQSHSAGAVIEAVVTSSMFEEWYNVLNPEHTSTGGHVISGTASISTLVTDTIVGAKGQFAWSQDKALVTSVVTNVGNNIAFQRATQELTIDNFWAGVQSAPSIGTLQLDVNWASGPSGTWSSIFSTKPTIDVGEYTTDTAATPAVISFTSLASGVVLKPEVETPNGAGFLMMQLPVSSR